MFAPADPPGESPFVIQNPFTRHPLQGALPDDTRRQEAPSSHLHSQPQPDRMPEQDLARPTAWLRAGVQPKHRSCQRLGLRREGRALNLRHLSPACPCCVALGKPWLSGGPPCPAPRLEGSLYRLPACLGQSWFLNVLLGFLPCVISHSPRPRRGFLNRSIQDLSPCWVCPAVGAGGA